MVLECIFKAEGSPCLYQGLSSVLQSNFVLMTSRIMVFMHVDPKDRVLLMICGWVCSDCVSVVRTRLLHFTLWVPKMPFYGLSTASYSLLFHLDQAGKSE